MAAFYLDHDVALRVAYELRSRGHQAITSRQIGRESARDYDQLLTSPSRGLILVSHNGKDFRLLHGACGAWSSAWRTEQVHAGILIILQGRPEGSARLLDDFVGGQTESLSNAMFEYQTQGGWVPYPRR